MHELNAQLVAAHEALWEFRGEEPALLMPEELLARLSDGAALTRLLRAVLRPYLIVG